MGQKLTSSSSFFRFSQGVVGFLGGQEERKEEEGKGGRGRGEEGKEEGHVFLTFVWSKGEHPTHQLCDDLGQSIVHIMVASRS